MNTDNLLRNIPATFAICNTLNGVNVFEHVIKKRKELRKKIEKIRLERNDIFSPVHEVDMDISELNKITLCLSTDCMILAESGTSRFRCRAGNYIQIPSQDMYIFRNLVIQVYNRSRYENYVQYNKYDCLSPPLDTYEKSEYY